MLLIIHHYKIGKSPAKRNQQADSGATKRKIFRTAIGYANFIFLDVYTQIIIHYLFHTFKVKLYNKF